MSRLEELIAEYCTNGVEYKKVADICTIKRGIRITKKDLVDNGNYPVMSGGTSFMGRFNNHNRESNTITISSYGAAGYVGFITEPFWANDVCLTVFPNEWINNKYLYYALKNSEQYFYSKTTKAIPNHLPTEIIQEMSIPVPPLEVQREIVRILDNFTELTAELTAELTVELTARKKQYEYYRDSLLSKDESVSMRTIDSLCKVSAGGDAPKDAMSKDKTDEYTIPIISNGVGENALYGYTNQAKIMEPAVTVAARGTIGYAEYRDYPFVPIIRLLSLIPNDTEELDTKFLYYCLQGKEYNVPTTGIPQLTAPMVKQVEIPLLNISVQRKIVEVLDNFEKICTDLNIGLPAEIEARQKQYEFYRDLLLTFAETGNIIATDRQTDRQTIIRLIQYVFGYAPVILDEVFLKVSSINWKKEVSKKSYIDLTSVSRESHCIVDDDVILINSNTAPSRAKQVIKANDILFGSTRPMLKRYCIVSDKYDNQVCSTGYCVLRIDNQFALTNYIYHIIGTTDFYSYIEVNQQGASYPAITDKSIKRYKISLPTIEEQERIVSILDKFDSLCNDISSGLPAEIEARQKQYEYYRDKLLTFKEISQ